MAFERDAPKAARPSTLRWATEMKLFLLSLSFTFLSVVHAAEMKDITNESSQIVNTIVPAKDAFIKGHTLDNNGFLHVIYSDGSNIEIQKERGRNSYGDTALQQVSFSHIKVSEDRQHIGWLADYEMCSQSYPCTMELAIFRAGFPIRYFSPPSGVVWDWMFLKDGSQAAIHYGFPHGDENGAYSLYDVQNGKLLNNITDKKSDSPHWVKSFEIKK